MAEVIKSPIKVLLVGQTGSGKTDFVNLFGNYAELNARFDFEKIQVFIDETSASMTSSTLKAQSYQFEFGDCIIELIDTPGFADNRGKDQQEKNKKNIMEYLKENRISCLCVMINGTFSRLNDSFQTTMLELMKFLPSAVLENTMIIFSNANSLQYEVNRDLKEEMKRQLLLSTSRQDAFAINNPFSLWSNWKADGASEICKEDISRKFQESFELLGRIREIAKSNESSTVSELAIAAANLKDEIDIKIREICSIKRNKTKTQPVGIESVEENKCTLCTFEGCHSNCHYPCSYSGFWIEAAKYCKVFKDSDECSVCGHNFIFHRRCSNRYYRKRNESGEFEFKRDGEIFSQRRELLLALTKYHRMCYRLYQQTVQIELKLCDLSHVRVHPDYKQMLEDEIEEASEINKLPFDIRLTFEEKLEWALQFLGFDSVKHGEEVEKRIIYIQKFCCNDGNGEKCLKLARHAKGILSDAYHRHRSN